MNDLLGINNQYMAEVYSSMNKTTAKAEGLKNKLQNSSTATDEELMEACQTFEGYFLQMMYKSMRQTVDTSSGFLRQSNAEKIFQDMLDEENCKNAAEGENGVGLAQVLYKQLSRTRNNIIN